MKSQYIVKLKVREVIVSQYIVKLKVRTVSVSVRYKTESKQSC